MSASTDKHAEEGLSRRVMLSRSAAGVGIALTGSVSGLFGAGAAPQARPAAASPARSATAR